VRSYLEAFLDAPRRRVRERDAMQDRPNFVGATYRRGDSGYEPARRATCRNMRLPDRYPDMIVQASTEQDAVAAIRLANANGWPVGVRSGGHSWSCNHVHDGGMLLDVSSLNAVTIDRQAMRASVGPGCRGNDLDPLLAAQKLFFPVGHCQGVGLGGYLLQGGFGWHGRALGPACENVLAVDYVGADGELRHASPSENADVYWAARGAGPGFFGIVTRFHLQLHPRPKVIGGKFAVYRAEHFEALASWMHQVGPEVPASIELMLILSRNVPFIDGPGVMVVAPVFADSLRAAWRDLSFMRSRPRGAKLVTPFVPTRLSTMTARVMHHYPDQHHYAVDNMWTHASFDELRPGLARIAETLPPAPSHMLWMNWAPKAKRQDMAYSMEDDIYIALYGIWEDGAGEPAASTWAVNRMKEMAPLAKGVQLADENLAERAAPFMAAANLTRLDQLRAAHDPSGRFHHYGGRP
jgi:FAD/FMN-containing dehydrogenase